MSERPNRWPHMGQMFVEKGRLTSDELASALAHQKETGEPLGEILIAREHISRIDLAAALSRQWTWRSAEREADVPAVEDPGPTAENGAATVVADPTARAVVADLKAQLITTHEQLAAAEARLAGLERDVSDLTKAFGALQKYLYARQQEVEALRAATQPPEA